MIYVLKVPQYNNKEGKLVWSIKIGYSENWKLKRKVSYESMFGRCGEGFTLLYSYEDGTLEDEAKLKEYFKSHIFRGDEWFKDNPELLNFFEVNNTIDKLREALKLVMPKRTIRANCINPYLIDYIMNNFDEIDPIKKVSKYNDVVKNLRFYPPNKHIEVACNLYSLDKDSVLKYIEERVIKSQEISAEIIKLSEEINSLRNVQKKLKAIVEFSELPETTEKDILDLLELLPGKYKDYYTLLGSDKIRSCSYQEATIKKEWRKMVFGEEIKDDLVDHIFGSFKVGGRYSKSNIKDTLKKLYKDLEYEKTAKATDLELYFIIKEIKLQDSSGKRINGFEILGKR